jgi:hypothetical protein
VVVRPALRLRRAVLRLAVRRVVADAERVLRGLPRLSSK